MEKTYTTKEAAAELGLTYDYVRKLLLAWAGAPIQTVGNNKIWSGEQVEALRRLIAKGKTK